MGKNLLAILACVLVALCVISCDNHTHTYSDEWSSDDTYHWHAATCEHTSEVKDKAEHVWDGGKVTTPATAEKAGVKTYTCTVCKKTKTEEIADYEHEFSTWKDEGNGKHCHECSICGLKEEKDHDWDEGKETTAPTCTDKGVKTFTCTDCKATKTAEIDALGHEMSTWSDVADDATKRTRECTRRGCSYSETLPVISGTGSEDDPYEIATLNGMKSLASRVNGAVDKKTVAENFSGKIINLIQDIDLKNEQWTPIGLYSDEEDSSGFEKKPFSGTFNGQNHTISGLKIELDNGKSSYRALFGYVNGTVENLTVEGTVIACDSAGVVGALGDGGKIDHVTSKVTVLNTTSTGGDYPHAKAAGIVVAVKKGSATISYCTNEGSITSAASDSKDDAVGGIVAWSNANKLTITECVNNGKITSNGGNQYAGGIIGAVRKPSSSADAEVTVEISNCRNNGVITAKSNIVGGIVGAVGTYTTDINLTLTGCTTVNSYKLIGADGRKTKST